VNNDILAVSVFAAFKLAPDKDLSSFPASRYSAGYEKSKCTSLVKLETGSLSSWDEEMFSGSCKFALYLP
jgi:hypothetical protein